MEQENPNKFILTDKIPPLHLACGQDNTRPVMSFIRFMNGFAACTNGHLIVTARTEHIFQSEFAIELEGYFINASGYKYLYDRLKKGMVLCELTEEGIVIDIDEDHTHTVHIFTEYELKDRMEGDHKFPNWESLWNEAGKRANDPDIYSHWIQVNPTFIATIHSIFGSPATGMKIRPSGENKAILVSANTDKWQDMYAILMPVMKSQTEFDFIEVPNNVIPTF